MEPESRAGKAARRRRALRRYIVEFLLACAFIVALLVTRAATASESVMLRAAAVLLPALVLTLWFATYVIILRGMDELEQAMETRSLAMACGVTLWITTVWGLASVALGAPALPVVFVAPLAAAVFGVVRVIVGARYR